MNSIRACVFDAYGTLFDVHSAVMGNADQVGDCAEAFSALWRQRQLEYSWTRTMMGKYSDFWQLTIEALDFALQTYGLEGNSGLRESLLNAYFELKAYPDAADSLATLKAQGYVTAILSNGNNEMLRGAIAAGGLGGLLDDCISADEIKTYKPDPSVYQLACDRLKYAPTRFASYRRMHGMLGAQQLSGSMLSGSTGMALRLNTIVLQLFIK